MKQIEEPARRIPVRAEVDVLVVGAGPAGLMAAQAAALEKGTKVMLVESRGFLGGNMTIGLPLLGFLGRKGNVVIKGLPLQFVERLQEKGLATHHRACPLHVSLTMIDPEGTKHLAFQIIKECGIDLLMYAFATDVIMEGNTVKGVIIDSKKGREAILAKRVIDCTGDGDIAYRAGAPMNYGNEKGIPQPPTLMFSMRGVDSRKLRDAVADRISEEELVQHLVAITDPGSMLERQAREEGWAAVFSGQPTVGGRFSALSVFGLLPAALVGIDLEEFMAHAIDAERQCSEDAIDNPAIGLASFLYDNYLQGRNKFTFLTQKRGRVLGLWIEQLVSSLLKSSSCSAAQNSS